MIELNKEASVILALELEWDKYAAVRGWRNYKGGFVNTEPINENRVKIELETAGYTILNISYFIDINGIKQKLYMVRLNYDLPYVKESLIEYYRFMFKGIKEQLGRVQAYKFLVGDKDWIKVKYLPVEYGDD